MSACTSAEPHGGARLRIAVLASGRGSNFAALVEACRDGRLPIDIVELICDRSSAPVVGVADAAGIAHVVLDPQDYHDRAEFDRALFARLDALDVTLVVLAGFMRILPARALEAWHGRMINIHPSLLPRHPGLHTHRRALDAGDREHGASVHYVSAEVDQGALIAQVMIGVERHDTPASLAARLLGHEHALLVASVNLIARGRLCWSAHGPLLDGERLCGPLRLCSDGHLLPVAACP